MPRPQTGPNTHDPGSLWSALLDLVASRDCGGCTFPPPTKSPLCTRCAAILASQHPRRAALTRVLPAQGTPPPRTFATAHYDDPVRAMIIHYKERGRVDLTRPLATALARAVSAHAPPPPVALIPMPSSRHAVRHRGRDSTLHLARAAAAELRRTNTPTRTLPILRHTRPVADQAGLDRTERARNLAGALRISPRHRHLLTPGLSIVLVDDVVTTGATLTEAARVIRTHHPTLLAATIAAVRFE